MAGKDGWGGGLKWYEKRYNLHLNNNKKEKENKIISQEKKNLPRIFFCISK